ncbi:hypothetical protein BC828DRAFT_379309 [Blastocladiella britannica]|nr:hypothetical protein BC828DRAFT_379309 [Blastocladiella britannica]
MNGSHALTVAIQTSLDAHETDSALFLADLLVADLPECQDARYWQAKCHLSCGRPGAAFHVLAGTTAAAPRFLLARAALALGDQDAALGAILGLVDPASGTVRVVPSSTPILAAPPTAASMWLLAGQIYARHVQKIGAAVVLDASEARIDVEVHARALQCFQRALSLNPFLWEAVDGASELCAGHTFDASSDWFKENMFSATRAAKALSQLSDARPCGIMAIAHSSAGGSKRARSPSSSLDRQGEQVAEEDRPPAHKRTTSSVRTRSMASSLPALAVLDRPALEEHQQHQHQHQKRKPTVDMDGVLGILTSYARATQLLAIRQPRDAIKMLQALPTPHRTSPATERLLGRAHHAMRSAARQTARHFASAHARAPWDVRAMDAYSSSLWLLAGEGDGAARDRLRALELRMRSLAPHSPETWVVTGNRLSAEGNRGGAVTALERAVQLSKRLGQSSTAAYVLALLGMEMMDGGELVRAQHTFLAAIEVQPQSPFALSGLGKVLQRLGSPSGALRFFKEAYECSRSAFDAAHVGEALLELGRGTEALGYLSEAIVHDSEDPSLQLTYAKALMASNLPENALAVLDALAIKRPTEPDVHYLRAYGRYLLQDDAGSIEALLHCMRYSSAAERDAIDATLASLGSGDRLSVFPVNHRSMQGIKITPLPMTSSSAANGQHPHPPAAGSSLSRAVHMSDVVSGEGDLTDQGDMMSVLLDPSMF